MFSMMVDYLRQDDAAETPLETVSFIFGGVTVAPFRVVFRRTVERAGGM
jgi:hypothetical protein